MINNKQLHTQLCKFIVL